MRTTGMEAVARDGSAGGADGRRLVVAVAASSVRKSGCSSHHERASSPAPNVHHL
jgi:hypothetical protein